jgi:hypothetical protein
MAKEKSLVPATKEPVPDVDDMLRRQFIGCESPGFDINPARTKTTAGKEEESEG